MERSGNSFEKRFQCRMRAKSSDAFYLLCAEGGALWYGHNTAVVMLRFPHKMIKFAHKFALWQICCLHRICGLTLGCKCIANLIFHPVEWTRNVTHFKALMTSVIRPHSLYFETLKLRFKYRFKKFKK